MIKKHLIIVISFLLEGTSKLLLIKVIHQGATVPFLEALLPGPTRGSLPPETRCLINTGILMAVNSSLSLNSSLMD